MRTVFIVGLALVTAGLLSAQPHPNGYACGVINFTKKATEPTVYIVDSTGKVVSSIGGPTNNVHGIVMGPNNLLLYVTSLDGRIYKMDPKAGTNVGVVTSLGINLRDIAVGQNGDLYFSDSYPNDAVYRLSASGVLQTLAVLGDNPQGGMDIDIDTGDLLVQSGAGADPLRRIARDGTVVTIIGSGFDARYGGALHIPTGDWYSGSCCGDSTTAPESIYVLRAGQSVATVFAAFKDPAGVYAIKPDRASAAKQRLIVGSYHSISNPARGQGLYYVDLATQGVSKLSSVTTSSIYEVEVLYRRNVHSVMIGKGKWRIGIRIPEDAGKTYVLVAGASGVRPGVTFPSGRTAWLVPDAITLTSLLYGLAPFLTPTKGTLDANGYAAATLDVSTLGPAANGFRLWFLALTLDKAAPDGVKTITDPHVLTIEGL